MIEEAQSLSEEAFARQLLLGGAALQALRFAYQE
jgi:hypothetical protein